MNLRKVVFRNFCKNNKKMKIKRIKKGDFSVKRDVLRKIVKSSLMGLGHVMTYSIKNSQK